MADREKLQEEILGLLREEVKDLWEQEDEEFLKELSFDLAREKVLSSTSDNPDEHEKNLLHLAATLQGEVAKKRLKLNKKGRDLFVRVLTVMVKTVALSALGIA
jgi:hypothetical protein